MQPWLHPRYGLIERSKPTSGLWLRAMIVRDFIGCSSVFSWPGSSSSPQPSSNASLVLDSKRPVRLDFAPRPRGAGPSFAASAMSATMRQQSEHNKNMFDMVKLRQSVAARFGFGSTFGKHPERCWPKQRKGLHCQAWKRFSCPNTTASRLSFRTGCWIRRPSPCSTTSPSWPPSCSTRRWRRCRWSIVSASGSSPSSGWTAARRRATRPSATTPSGYRRTRSWWSRTPPWIRASPTTRWSPAIRTSASTPARC